MKRISFLTAILLAVLLTACSEQDLFEPESDTIELVAGISPVASETRADIAFNGKGSFTSGDAISLFILPEQATAPVIHTMTLENGAWSPRLSWSDLQTDNALFSAYYPVLGTSDAGAYIHTVATDQRNRADYEKSDLLCASVRASRNQPVQLDFHHAMSLVSVTLRSNGAFTEQELASAVILINGYNHISFHPQNATLGAVNGSPARITAHNTGNASFQAVVCPQAILQEWHDNAWMEIQIAGKTLHYKAPKTLTNGDAFQSLESGKRVSFTINLNKEEAKDDWSNKTVWVYGLKDMPATSEWGYAYLPPHESIGLKWDRKYGWFDCNKVNPYEGTGLDSNMCWAAATSNMIYWWLDRNKENVARYGYTGPQTYKNSLECDVFDLFKRNFPDEGNFLQTGLNWYFRGQYGMTVKPGAGFFKDVFDTPPFRVASPYSLTDDLKLAFTNKECIGFSIEVYSGRGRHAMNIWGADFDENGQVCAVYIVDNNDRELDEQPEFCSPKYDRCQVQAGIYRKRIQYMPDGPYMESGFKDKFTIKIDQLIFLGTTEAEWAEYFRKHPEK